MSYGAGVGEETVFRGFLMPVARNLTGSDWIANGISSTVFAAAHISSDYQYPVAQFLFGTYVAWLSQYRNWTLAEGIFIHTWWDTISILSEYAATQKINHFAISPIKIEF
jgi:membrane protease YdiL (CAAX protease family)